MHHLVQPAGARVCSGVPYGRGAVFFALVFTLLNIQGVKLARVNSALAAEWACDRIFFVVAARYIFGHPHDGAASIRGPSTTPSLWNTKAVLSGTSIAVLTYIGFEKNGISTLSEEAETRAAIFCCNGADLLVIGILSAVRSMPPVDLAGVAAISGRRHCFRSRGRPRLEADVWHYSDSPCWSPTRSGAWARRSVGAPAHGMGRSNALPKSFFGGRRREASGAAK